MKVMTIDSEGKPQMVDIAEAEEKDCPYRLYSTLIKHEAQDWRQYKGMGERYLNIAHQEFTHMLMGIYDLLTTLKDGHGLDEYEKKEADKLLATLKG